MNIKHSVIAQDVGQILTANLPWHQLAGRDVLVTGCTGMIGGYITAVLLYLCQQLDPLPKIHLLVRNKAKAEAYFKCDLAQCVYIYDDITQCQIVPDFIFHAASPASPSNYATDPISVIKANVFGTWDILSRYHCDEKTKFIFISSPDVYGQLPSDIECIGEESFFSNPTLNVRNCYGESKRMAENLLACWHYQFGVDYRIIRPFHTFGPGLKLNDGRVFADFIKSAVEGTDIIMTSDGCALRTFCYLADTVEAIFYATLNGQTASSYNVGAPFNEMSIRDFAQSVLNLVPEKNIAIVQTSPDLKKYIPSSVSRGNPDINKISRLGWVPKTDIMTALHRTYAYLV